MSSTRTHDAIIIGGGHNGLVCAAYLGMAGLKVKVLERRAVVGGAAVTEEFYPGFRNSVAAYTVSLLNPQVTADLRLADHGLKIVERRAQNFLPAPDGSHLLTGEGLFWHGRHGTVGASLTLSLSLKTSLSLKSWACRLRCFPCYEHRRGHLRPSRARLVPRFRSS